MISHIRRRSAGWLALALALTASSGTAWAQGALQQRVQQIAAQDGGTQAAAPSLTVLQRLRQQALERERAMELPDALMRWRFILALNPKHAEAAARIPVLEDQIKLLAATHFERAVSLYRKKQREDALREFLLVLNYNPDHADALDYVRNKLKPPDWVYYTTVQGDSMKVIAKKAYQDEQKDFLVAAYNNLSRGATITPGMVLQLPIIESDLRKPSVNVGDVLKKAKELLDQGQFSPAIEAAESILVYDPGNAFAREIMNASYYTQAKELATQNKNMEALSMFKNVEPGYRDTREAMAAVQNSLKGVAEEHYKKGVQAFINEQLDSAIAEWEQTLRIFPGHPKAQQDLDNARQLRDRLQQVQR